MNYLMYHPRTRPTGRRLGQYMGIDHGTDPGGETRPDFLIRWGNRAGVPLVPTHTTINRKAAMDEAAGRINQIRTLREAGIPVPRIAMDARDLDFPVLGRSNGGMGGQGITFYPTLREWLNGHDNHDLYVQHIPKEREFRVHVIGGRVEHIAEKRPREARFRDRIVWNYDNGFIFGAPRGPVPRAMKVDAMAAVANFDLDFGAVDLIMDSDGRHYLLEINTAPALDDANLQRYGNRLAQLIGVTDVAGLDAVDHDFHEEDVA